jgi:hypothetical protein
MFTFNKFKLTGVNAKDKYLSRKPNTVRNTDTLRIPEKYPNCSNYDASNDVSVN